MKRAQGIALLKLAGGWIVALTLAWAGIVVVQAQAGAPGYDSEGWRSSVGSGRVSPAGADAIQADVQQTSTYTLLSYVPFGQMLERRSHHLTGVFSGANAFYVCPGAQDAVVTSTGSLCTYYSDIRLIDCLEGLTGVHFTYTCISTPTVQSGLLDLRYSFQTSYDVDRLVDVYFSPLLYRASTLPPTLIQPDHLRWVDQDNAYFSVYVTYDDPRLSKTFVPTVRQE